MLSDLPSPHTHPSKVIPQIITCILLLLGGGCGSSEDGVPPPLDELYNPVGLAAHPDGRYLFVTNSVFNREYNSSSVVVIDTFERRILSDRGIEVDLFAGEIGVQRVCKDPSRSLASGCEERVVGLVPSRDQGTLTSFEITRDDADAPRIRCGQRSGSKRCGSRFVQASLLDDASQSGPFSLSMDDKGAYLTHLNSGLVSRWQFTGDDPLVKLGCQVRLRGANFVAQHPTNGVMLASHRLGQTIYQADVTPVTSDLCEFNILPNLNSNYNASIGEGRGLAFSADGSLLYHVQSAEEVLYIYQTLRYDNGQLSYRPLTSIPIGQGANVVRVAGTLPDERRPREFADETQAELDRLGQGLVYISATNDDHVLVVDPRLATVIATIDVGKGPYDISFMLNQQGELRGYVSLFRDQAVSVLDLHPGSPTRFTEIEVMR
jgi:YVTN family beta-propeller protein